jgi:hypothetical protein
MITFHKVSLFFVYDNLVGGLEHYFFPFSWECNHPN